MQVSAISSAVTPESIQAGQTGYVQSFGRRSALTEDEIREVALRASVRQAKQRQRNTKRMYLAVPFIAAATAGILHDGGAKILGKEISGKAAKVAAGLSSGGGWAYMLGLASAIGIGNVALANKSEGYANFRRKHTLLSFAGDIAMFLAALTAIPVGVGKLASKIKPQHLEKITKGVENMANKINDIHTPKFITNAYKSVTDAIPKSVSNATKSVSDAIPQGVKDFGGALKNVGKLALSFAPSITFLAALLSSMTSQSKFMNDYTTNYIKLKERVGNTEA